MTDASRGMPAPATSKRLIARRTRPELSKPASNAPAQLATFAEEPEGSVRGSV